MSHVLTGIDLGQAVVAILAVLAISSEYSTGMIRVTLTATPRRATVLAGRLILNDNSKSPERRSGRMIRGVGATQ
jgi:hypothetical protein